MNERGDYLRVVSHFPGRLRVRAVTFRRHPEVGAAAAARVAEEPGVLSAVASTLTGSILVEYDPLRFELPRLVDRLVEIGGLGGIEVDASGDDIAGVSDATLHVRAVAGAANEVVARATRGRVDLRAGVPMTFATLGLAKLAFGKRRLPEWYDMMIWAFTTFVALNSKTLLDDDAARPRS